MKKLHYESSGDNYKLKDPFKIKALKATLKTKNNLNRFKKYGLTIKEIPQSRGDSAFRIEFNLKKPLNFQLAHVEESLGTKNIIAQNLDKSFYFASAIDNVSSIVNDLSTSGAFPLTFMLHIAAFPNEWYLDSKIIDPLLEGTVAGCNLAGLVWGGGESGTDRDIIKSGTALLSGSATGIILDKKYALSEDKLKVGDRIIFFESSGVHTNGITLLRKELLKKLPKGYQTKLSDGTTYGQSLMTPSVIYSRLIEELILNSEIHYGINITGHGLRKIMRANKNFTYIIEDLLPPQPIFETIQQYSNSTNYNMYDTYNMGQGFAIFVPDKEVETVLKISKKHKIKAIDAGFIKKGDKKVILKPLNIEFSADSLNLR